MFVSRSYRVALAATVMLIATLAIAPLARADGYSVILHEDFATDPLGTRAVVDPAGDLGRFTYNAGSQSLTASYNTMQPTAKLAWQLPGGKTLTDADAFRFTTTFTIDSISGAYNEFAQVAFGLINSATTGDDRAGGTFTDALGAFDIVTVDYFPNLSDFASPTVGATVNESNVGQGYLATFTPDFSAILDDGAITFPFGPESDLGDEALLPTATALTAVLVYDPVSRSVSLTINSLALNLVGAANAVGGPDGDTTTIQTFLRPDATFAVDAFALTLWEDTFRASPSAPSTTGTLTFDAFTVEAVTTPEPASAVGFVMLTAMATLRRRPR